MLPDETVCAPFWPNMQAFPPKTGSMSISILPQVTLGHVLPNPGVVSSNLAGDAKSPVDRLLARSYGTCTGDLALPPGPWRDRAQGDEKAWARAIIGYGGRCEAGYRMLVPGMDPG
jgi:hypothetical protein